MEKLFSRDEWFKLEDVPHRKHGELTLDEQFHRAVENYVGSVNQKDRESTKRRLKDWWKGCVKDGWVPPGHTQCCLMSIVDAVERRCITKTKVLKAGKHSKLSAKGRKVSEMLEGLEKLRCDMRCLCMGTSVTECIQTRKPETLFQKAENKGEKEEAPYSKREEAEALAPPAAPAMTDTRTPSSGLYPTLPHDIDAHTPESPPPYAKAPHMSTNPFLSPSPQLQMPTLLITEGRLQGDWVDNDGMMHAATVTTRPKQGSVSYPMTKQEMSAAQALVGHPDYIADIHHSCSKKEPPTVRRDPDLDTDNSCEGGSGDFHPDSQPFHNTEGSILTRSQKKKKEQSEGSSDEPLNMQAPILCKFQQGNERMWQYKPFTPAELVMLQESLPPIAQGGSQWLIKLVQLTRGQTLTTGDIKGLLGRVCTQTDYDTVVTGLPFLTGGIASDPLTRQDSELFLQHLKECFPTPPFVYSDLILVPTDGEQPADFVRRSYEEYTTKTGETPVTSALNTQMYRAAVLRGMPAQVTKAMEANPDLPGADHARWCSHLQHHMKRHMKEEASHSSKIKALEEQLLGLKLQEAKQAASQPKKGKIQALLTEQAAAPHPTPHPHPSPYVPQPPWDHPTSHIMYQGNYRGRSGTYQRPNWGQGGLDLQNLQCWNCGRYGHMSRNCSQGYVPRGRGQSRGAGPQRRGGRGGFPPQHAHQQGPPHHPPGIDYMPTGGPHQPPAGAFPQ